MFISEGLSVFLKEVITIDGPAGSGKSTAARLTAHRLNATMLDTGAIYRCVAYAAVNRNIATGDPGSLVEMIGETEIRFDSGSRENPAGRIFLDGLDVTTKIRTPEISRAASEIAALPEVREALLELQRKQALQGEQGVMVAEGRDMGTVVFPDAPHKFFLSADPATRAERRYRELLEMGRATSLEEVLADQEQRDLRDRNRQTSPLRPADDACVIDSTKMTVEEVVDKILEKIEEKRNNPGFLNRLEIGRLNQTGRTDR